jgi:hypothetical protein
MTESVRSHEALPRSTSNDDGVTGTLRLDAAHLDDGGLALDWFLRECCRRHWRSLALAFASATPARCEAARPRPRARFAACLVEGRLDLFKEGEAACLTTLEPARPANGWRSRSVLCTVAGHHVAVELVSASIPRHGSADPMSAGTPSPSRLVAEDGEEAADRAGRILARGRALRLAALADPQDALMRSTLAGRGDGEPGLFADCLALLSRAEAAAANSRRAGRPVVRREFHAFDGLERGAALTISTRPLMDAAAPTAGMRLAVRRERDGALVALAQTTRRSGAPTALAVGSTERRRGAEGTSRNVGGRVRA